MNAKNPSPVGWMFRRSGHAARIYHGGEFAEAGREARPPVHHFLDAASIIMTANLALDAADRHWIPAERKLRRLPTNATTVHCRARTRRKSDEYGEKRPRFRVALLLRRSLRQPSGGFEFFRRRSALRRRTCSAERVMSSRAEAAHENEPSTAVPSCHGSDDR